MDNKDHEVRIQEILKEIRLYKNPEELEALKKTIKKQVPFTMRGYFMAYLFATKSGSSQPNRKASEKTEKSPVQRPEASVATSFYINVGKISHSNPKELSAFICEKSGLEPEDVLSVAFKQNYSFVYIKKEKADGVIAAVTGQTFKGRKVKMNFSKDSGSEQ